LRGIKKKNAQREKGEENHDRTLEEGGESKSRSLTSEKKYGEEGRVKKMTPGRWKETLAQGGKGSLTTRTST